MLSRILITGSKGILGKRLVEVLQRSIDSIEIIESNVDLTNKEKVDEYIASLPDLDIVFHLAALVPVNEVRKNPLKAFSVNVGGTLNLLTSLKERELKLIFASTSHVYATKDGPINENDPLKPVSVYGETKLVAESLIEKISRSSNWSYLIARIFSMHDSNQTSSFLRPNLEKRFLSEDLTKPFHLDGGKSKRDFLPAEKVAEFLVQLAFAKVSGTFNIASGLPMTVSDFAQSLSSRNLNIVPKGEANDLYAETTKLVKTLAKN